MNIKNSFKHFLGRYPVLFFPLYRKLAPQHHIQECMLNSESELVIEGFPRSANTFAVVAFRQAQGREVPMAHHLHVEAQVLKGASLGSPVIVLIRNPTDAVKSLLIRHPGVVIDDAFRRYIDFYSAVERVAEKVVLADFKQVTSDFSDIITQVNRKFGTSYQVFEHTPKNVEAVYKEIDEINKALDGGEESHVARPSMKREKMAVDIPTSSISETAENIYRRLIENAAKKVC